MGIKRIAQCIGLCAIMGVLASAVLSCTESIKPFPSQEHDQSKPDITSPLITGEDWNNMTLSEKRTWVNTCLDSIMQGEELEESERQPADYYVQRLDDIFYNPDNAKKLVAWELTSLTSPASETTNGITMTLEEKAYNDYIVQISDTSVKALARVIELLEKPRPHDDLWIIDVELQVALVKRSYDFAIELIPPDSVKAIHNDIVEGMSHLDKGCDLLIPAGSITPEIINQCRDEFTIGSGLVSSSLENLVESYTGH